MKLDSPVRHEHTPVAQLFSGLVSVRLAVAEDDIVVGQVVGCHRDGRLAMMPLPLVVPFHGLVRVPLDGQTTPSGAHR